MIVTFSGLQGSGKTTFAQALTARLQEQGVRAIFRSGWRSLFLRFVFALFALRQKAPKEFMARRAERDDNLHGSGAKASRARRVLPILTLLDWWCRCAVWRVISRGRVLVLDTSSWESIHLFEYNKTLGARLRNAFARVPQGDLAYFMSVAPEVAFQRRRPGRFTRLEQHQFAARVYDELQSQRPKLVLDGTADLDAQLTEVSEEVLKRLNRKRESPTAVPR